LEEDDHYCRQAVVARRRHLRQLLKLAARRRRDLALEMGQFEEERVAAEAERSASDAAENARVAVVGAMPPLAEGPVSMCQLWHNGPAWREQGYLTRRGCLQYSSGDLFTEAQATFLCDRLPLERLQQVRGILHEFYTCRERNHGAQADVVGGHYVAIVVRYEERIGSSLCYSADEWRLVPYGEQVTTTYYRGFPSGDTQTTALRAVEGQPKLVTVQAAT